MSTLRSVILCCTACSFIGQAQAQALSREHIDDWLKNLGASDQFDASKGIDWGVMPGPFYTPELGLGIGTAIGRHVSSRIPPIPLVKTRR